MKAPQLITIISLLFFSSCKIFSESGDQPTLDGVRWQLIAMDRKPADLGDKAYITFDDKERKAAGKAACNSFSSEYELLRNKLSFGSIASTKMYCEGLMDNENQIITNLQKVKRFEIKYGLLYLYGSDDLLLTYKKVNTGN